MRYKDIRYYRGDDIEIKLKGQRKSIKGRVVDFTDSTISVNKSTHNLTELRSVIRRKDLRQDKAIVKASKLLPIIGLGYLALGFVNGMILYGEVGVTDTGLKVAAAGVGSGLTLRPFASRRYRIDRKWRLRVMDMGRKPQ